MSQSTTAPAIEEGLVANWRPTFFGLWSCIMHRGNCEGLSIDVHGRAPVHCIVTTGCLVSLQRGLILNSRNPHPQSTAAAAAAGECSAPYGSWAGGRRRRLIWLIYCTLAFIASDPRSLCWCAAARPPPAANLLASDRPGENRSVDCEETVDWSKDRCRLS